MLSIALNSLRQQLDQLALSSASGWRRLQAPITINHPLAWLIEQPLWPRLYWHGRESNCHYVGLGALELLGDEADLTLLSARMEAGARYFGGVAFDELVQAWPEFGTKRWILPRVELVWRGERAELCLNLDLDVEQGLNAGYLALEQLVGEGELPALPPLTKMRRDSPDYHHWCQLVESVTDPESLAQTPKVVLSRATELTTVGALNPWALLAKWQAATPSCFHFGFQFSPEQAFIGCSPERLYRRQGSRLETEALAGTAPRGSSELDDQALAEALLHDGKNGHENRLVHEDILRRLQPFCVTVERSATEIVRLPLVQHLRSLIQATLQPAVTDKQLIAALHPTPAVGGSPREAALDFLRAHEPYRRGWYAGACGMLSREESELAVAIRSALVKPLGLTLFAGAGIVAGSEAGAEWQELNNKMGMVLRLLGSL